MAWGPNHTTLMFLVKGTQIKRVCSSQGPLRLPLIIPVPQQTPPPPPDVLYSHSTDPAIRPPPSHLGGCLRGYLLPVSGSTTSCDTDL